MIESHELLQNAKRNVGQTAIRVASRGRAGRRISSGDLAQARLIDDLVNRFALDADGISAILALIGQVRALRKMLHALLATTTRLPEPLRARLHAELTDRQTTARRNLRRREKRVADRACPNGLIARRL
jgi:hypothetical protein